MTIEQLMILFILIEIFQVFFILVQVYLTRQEMKKIMYQPEYAGAILSNALHGFLLQLNEDSKEGESRRTNFYGFMRILGQNIIAGVTGNNPGEPMKPVKLKGGMKVFEPFVNDPNIRGHIVNEFFNKLKRKGEKKAVEVIDQQLEGWL